MCGSEDHSKESAQIFNRLTLLLNDLEMFNNLRTTRPYGL